MPNLATLGKYLKSDMVKDGDLIKFIDAGQMVTRDNKFKPGEKKTSFEITIETEGTKDKKTATVNFTSQKELAKVYGSDTEEWVGKIAKISKIKQNVGGVIKDVVYILPVDAVIDVNKE